mmetsp:Transcript_111905/g.357177  ORF Transcript_111905/g.357177 Transcript_111905/m.357177 type:complete len:284 (+) Transcript_111905:58-909(+)|eukprot:CAMPEP_0175641554 /NCGR_PEP_ID=MMETSP0097-20121207/4819_1 /TAXON_ID=311494 /ORGANISM="Alexandrium monilatum, Strain CCMP3105" /LENGTH=283 /DNA_ID=CAMNT_0016947331 /DNA_START=21 /DNA_END=872 /DNA_ORIENTATION=-
MPAESEGCADAPREPPANGTCRICQLPGAGEPLLSPCLCTGSVEFVHKACLDEWRARAVNRKHASECELCGFQFRYEMREATLREATRPYWLPVFLPFSASVAVGCMCGAVTAPYIGVVAGAALWGFWAIWDAMLFSAGVVGLLEVDRGVIGGLVCALYEAVMGVPLPEISRCAIYFYDWIGAYINGPHHEWVPFVIVPVAACLPFITTGVLFGLKRLFGKAGLIALTADIVRFGLYYNMIAVLLAALLFLLRAPEVPVTGAFGLPLVRSLTHPERKRLALRM